MKMSALVSVVGLALAVSSCGGGGGDGTGPCHTIDGTAASGLQECNYLVNTNHHTCAQLMQLDGHCPSSGFVGCCVHTDGSAVCYSQDDTGAYQANCAAPDKWQGTPP